MTRGDLPHLTGQANFHAADPNVTNSFRMPAH